MVTILILSSMALCTVWLIGSDIIAAMDNVPGNTISEFITYWFSHHGIWSLPFAFGVLGGHWFVSQPWRLADQPIPAILLVVLALSVTVVGRKTKGLGKFGMSIVGFSLILFGILCGALFWSQ